MKKLVGNSKYLGRNLFISKPPRQIADFRWRQFRSQLDKKNFISASHRLLFIWLTCWQHLIIPSWLQCGSSTAISAAGLEWRFRPNSAWPTAVSSTAWTAPPDSVRESARPAELSAARGASSLTVKLRGKSGASSRASTGRLTRKSWWWWNLIN